MNEVQSIKNKFRRTARWLKFRKFLKKKQVTDPITGSKLTPTANCHHMDLNEDHYTDISDESHFILLNKSSHDTVHFLFNSHCGWRHAIDELVKILEKMEELNK